MKVTVPEHQSKTNLSTLLLELQLTNEQAQLGAAVSVYQELIAFCLQYAFDGEVLESSMDDIEIVIARKYLQNSLVFMEGYINWNNAHPWNAPADSTADIKGTWADTNDKDYLENWNAVSWGYNEWNRVYDSNPASLSELEKLKTGTGGQVIDICEWTRFNGKEGEREANSVAYSWGCWDSVFNFNFELQGQRKAIEKWREDNPESEYAQNSWNGTATQVKAPADDWGNYIFYADTDNKNPPSADSLTTTDKGKRKFNMRIQKKCDAM